MKVFWLTILLPLIFFPFFVINTTNPVYSAVSLACTFFFSGVLLFSVDCDFLGFVFILVYVGAIAVFFLLVIIMLKIKPSSKLPINFIKYGPLSYFIVFIFIFEIFYPFLNLHKNILDNLFFVNHYLFFCVPKIIIDAKIFGLILYTHFLIFFLMAGFILFIALLGSLMLLISNEDEHKTNLIKEPLNINKLKIAHPQMFKKI